MFPSMLKGVLLFIVSAICFTGMHLLVKSCSAGFPSEQLMFWRSATGLVILTSCLPFVRPRPVFFGPNLPALVLRAVLGSVALFAFYKAISLINVSNATMLCYTYPVFLSIFAALFLGERFDRGTAGLLALAVAGIVMIVKPGLGGAFAGRLIGLLSGVASGLALLFVVLLRRRGERSFVIVWYFFFFGTLLSGLFGSRFVAVPDGTRLIELVSIGLFSLAAQLAMTTGYRYLTASAGGILSLSVVPFTAFAAFLVLKERLDVLSIAGGVLVLVSAGVMTWFQNARRQRAPRIDPPAVVPPG